MAEINTTATGVSILTGVTPELIDRTTYSLVITTDSQDFISNATQDSFIIGQVGEYWPRERWG